MVKKQVAVKIQSGLEAKHVAMFIQKASNFKSNIWIEKGERKANGKSLLGLMSLGIGSGTNIVVIADGEDEEAALEELEQYLSLETV